MISTHWARAAARESPLLPLELLDVLWPEPLLAALRPELLLDGPLWELPPEPPSEIGSASLAEPPPQAIESRDTTDAARLVEARESLIMAPCRDAVPGLCKQPIHARVDGDAQSTDVDREAKLVLDPPGPGDLTRSGGLRNPRRVLRGSRYSGASQWAARSIPGVCPIRA